MLHCSFAFRGVNYALPAQLIADIGKDGRTWYQDAHENIAAYAARNGFDTGRACDVLAILSPRVSVAHNVKLAKSYLETGKAPGAMRARVRALEAYEAEGTISGPKVTAFSRALRGDRNAVVVDAWVYRGLGDQRRTPKSYLEVADKVRTLAADYGLPPADYQAAFWVGIRRVVGFRAEGVMKL